MIIVAKVFFTILEVMFFIGIIGSALVVILTSIDDIKELREQKNHDTKTVSPLHHSPTEAH